MLKQALPVLGLVLTLGFAFHGEASSEAASAGVPLTRESAEQFTVDGAHSSVNFRVRHMQAGMFWGRFNKVSGSFKLDADALGESFAKITVDAASVDSNSEARDRHLKNQDFFSVKEFPTMTFMSTKVEKAGEGRFAITGDLTLRGKTKSVTIEAEHTGTANLSPRTGLRSGYEATFTIKRSDFGMTYGLDPLLLDDEVRMIVGLEGMK